MRPDGRDEPGRPAGRSGAARCAPSGPSEPGGPPSSWRRAAWLAVAAASIVLVVLVFAAVRLAGPDRRSGQIDAFPGPPTGGLLTPQQPSTSAPVASPTGSSTDGERTTGAATSQPGDGRATVLESTGGNQPGEQQPTGRGGPEPTTGGPSAPSGTSTAPGVADAEPDVVDATHRFFGFLPENPEAAWQLVSPRAQLQGFEEFCQYWQQYSAVELQHVTVGASGTTVVTVVVTVVVTDHKGGSASQRWKLIYQVGETVVIDAFTLLEGGLQDPGGNKPFT